MDGTGYPPALKGEAIPWRRAFFAAVDVWMLCILTRPYRPAGLARKSWNTFAAYPEPISTPGG